MAEFTLPHGHDKRAVSERCDAVGGCRRASGVGDGAKPGVKGLIGRGEYRQMGTPEDKFLSIVYLSHSLFCDCKNPAAHIPPCRSTGGGEGGGEDLPDSVAVHFELDFKDEDTPGGEPSELR
ncbi:MAG: ORF2 protein [Anelloviridae sp.]|nr:MAG: ORF2 protein [Anelloviridae sp.]